VAGDTYDLVNRIRNPVTSGLKDMFGWGMDGGAARERRLYVQTRANPWIEYVKEFKKQHPGMKHKEALNAASKGYQDQKAGYAAKRKSYAPMRPVRAL
jgi:hypothetical protein